MKYTYTSNPAYEPNLVVCPKCQGKEGAYCSYCNCSGQIPEGADIDVEYEDYD